MCRRVDRCEKRIAIQEKVINEKIFKMAEKILRHPDGSSKELESREVIGRFVDEFIQS